MIANYQNPYMNNPYVTNPVNYMQGGYGNNMYQSAANNINGLPGRMVETFDSITANEVSMNGQPSIFIKNDLSEVMIKAWANDGTIKSAQYVPKTLEADNAIPGQEKSLVDLSQEFVDRFEILNERLDNIEKALLPKTSTRKKVDNNE